MAAKAKLYFLFASLAWLAHALYACPVGCQCTEEARKKTMCMDTDFLEVPEDIPTDTVELYLKGNRISTLRHNVFSSLESLQILIITDSRVRDIEPNAFSGLPNLSYLDLQKNMIGSLQSHAFSGLSKLQRLNLDHNDIATIDNFAFHGLNLTLLRMDEANRLRDISSKAFYSSSINVLHISNCTLSFRSMGALLPLKSSLRELSLDHNQQELVIPENLFQGFVFRRLELNYDGIRDTAFLEFVVSDELSLDGNPIGPVDFSRYPTLRRLRTLRLDRTNFRSVEARYFQGMDHLTHLHLSYNDIMTLSANLQSVFDGLQRLTLEGNYFYCSCELIWLKHWIPTANTLVLGASCSQPYEDDLVFVKEEDMQCTAPSIVAVTPGLKIAAGNQMTLTCTAKGIPPPSITWQLPNGGVTSATPSNDRNTTRNSGTYGVRETGKDDQGLYRCFASNPAGNVSQTVDVSIYMVASHSQAGGGSNGQSRSANGETPHHNVVLFTSILFLLLHHFRS